MSSRFIIVLLVIFLSSCEESNGTSESTETLEVGSYSWDSYRVKEMREGMTYSAMQLPIEYYIRKNIGVSNTSKVDSLAKMMNTERVIVTEFKHLNQKDVLTSDFTARSYEDAVKYMASNISNDYHFVTSTNDTIACSGVLFERNFNVVPFKRVVLYFNGVPPEETGKLIYNDRLFGNGVFTFRLNQQPIKN